MEVERSTSTTSEPGISEITWPVAVTSRSEWLRSGTATTALMTCGPGHDGQVQDLELAATTLARNTTANGTARSTLNRPPSSTGGR